MRLFTQKDQQQLDDLKHRLDVALEAAQRFAESNLRLGEINVQLTQEVIRIAQRQVPVVPEGDVEQPKSVSDNDRVVLEDPERQLRPGPGKPGRVD